MPKKTGELPGKAGVKSLSRKLANSRHGFDEHPGAHKIAGAFAKENRDERRTRAHESASGSTREGKTNTLDRMKRP
jgi:hypothetical protein